MEHFIDTCGEMCPLPIVRVKARLRLAKPGDVLRVLTDHACAVEALAEYGSGIGLDVEVNESQVGVWELVLTT
ncbi:MAG: sulfurtransferase TusA family protein [Bacillota bacterium]